jgi:Ca-activated chloride channel homolog
MQIEFNPAWVRAYRLIGYENRLLRAEDLHDDAHLGRVQMVQAVSRLEIP